MTEYQLDTSKIDTENMTESERLNYELALGFANAQIQRLRNPNLSETNLETVSFSTVSKGDLLSYLKNPKSSEKSIRNASISMYNTSTYYRRLINYYALMPTWAYIIKPLAYDPKKIGTETYKKAFYKAASQIEAMNLKHELQKALVVTLREGIFYGAIWQKSVGGSFSIQKINPDICRITSLEDGTWIYAVDMSRIKEAELDRYPSEFSAMYTEYKNTGNKYQNVPSKICFCLKADETSIEYSTPYWAASMPNLLDIENYKDMQETATEIGNYKLIHMKVPLDSTNAPKFDFELARKYYNMLCANLPPYVGASFSPMDLVDISFDDTGSLKDVDMVSKAERMFWAASGTSSLLFGDAVNTTAGALTKSITSDEAIVLSWVNQAERVVNRLLKYIPGTQKFQISFLPVTIFSIEKYESYYKNAATLGIPTKSAYAAVLGVRGLEIPGVDYVEREMLGMEDLYPLSSSYNTSSSGSDSTSGDVGRPSVSDDDLSESGDRTRENDENA